MDTTTADLTLLNDQKSEIFEYSVKIYNQYKQLVFDTQTKNRVLKISTTDFPNGIYIVNIFNREGVIQRQLLINK